MSTATPRTQQNLIADYQAARAAEDTHRCMLRYFTSDDGIWLTCVCGFEENLGWDATPAAAVAAENAHLETIR